MSFTPRRSNNGPSGEGPCHDVTAGADAQRRTKGQVWATDRMWRFCCVRNRVTRVQIPRGFSSASRSLTPSFTHLSTRSFFLVITKKTRLFWTICFKNTPVHVHLCGFNGTKSVPAELPGISAAFTRLDVLCWRVKHKLCV